jgi:quinol monooxygenase YgiN
MSSSILVVDSSEIREGKLAEVKAAVEDLVAFVEANETGPLAYDIYFDEAGTRMTVVQIHSRSQSLEHHLTVAGPVFRRFADLVTLERVDVYGRPSEAALEQMHSKAQLLGNAPVAVHELHSGFNRFAADSRGSVHVKSFPA